MKDYVLVFQSVEIVQRCDVRVEKIPSMDNLVDPLTMKLTRGVCIGHKDSIGFIWVSSMHRLYNALRASERLLR